MMAAILVFRQPDGSWEVRHLEAEPSHFVLFGQLLPGENMDGQRLLKAVQEALVFIRRRVLVAVRNIRQLPNANARVLGKLYQGDIFEVMRTQADWGEIGRVWLSGTESQAYYKGWIFLPNTEPLSAQQSQ